MVANEGYEGRLPPYSFVLVVFLSIISVTIAVVVIIILQLAGSKTVRIFTTGRPVGEVHDELATSEYWFYG